tara:strand:- start:488 stop:637 length:150 start_codon:yes stop_codon:yes gene_type:complete
MMKKRIKKEPSLAVIRAVTRLNNHAHKKASRSVIWAEGSITKFFPITSQ